MKKLYLLSGFLIYFISCSLDGDTQQAIRLLPIDESSTPKNFTFNTKDTITITYSLPNACHQYHSLYYQQVDTIRYLAVRSLEKITNTSCSQQIIKKELKIPINVLQKKDYVFHFWKGKDTSGKDLYEIKTVPVLFKLIDPK